MGPINSGGSAAFNLVVYNDENSQGLDFLIAGSDAIYSYMGSGNTQPNITCSMSLLSGPYAFTSTGFNLTSGGVSGALGSSGVVQFDGQGNTSGAITGTYTMNSNCLGTGTFTGSSGNPIKMGFSAFAGNANVITDADVTLGGTGTLLSGAIHSISDLTCSAATMTGTYSLTLTGRVVSAASAISGYFQGDGAITFDGQGNVTLTGTVNSDKGVGKAFSYSGAYTMPANCAGKISFTAAAGAVTATLVPYNGGKQFNFTGSDNVYAYSGSGFNVRPVACATATLSGPYTYDVSGVTLSGTAINGTADESGLLQFDGQGNVTGSYTVFSPGKSTSYTSTGTYSVSSGCLASATLTDSSNNANTLTFSLQNLYAQGADLIESSSTFVRAGSAHAAFVNPTQAIGNAASYALNATPPGSVFALFGQNLASRNVGASNVPLPDTLLNTTVTVNGEPAPLFYAGVNQIDAQMPWDIPAGALATVIVKNGSSTSNAAALYIPVAAPGIVFYGNNRAVVVNRDGSVNAGDNPAKVGDEVVGYFTGGGPVMAAGKLTTGAGAPGGLSPVNGNSAVTVGTAAATVEYIGLTPGGIGLYQVNFTVPSLAKGTYPLQITISGQASNAPVMTVMD